MEYLPFFSLETWILLITFIWLFVRYGYSSYGVFEKMGIPCPKPIMYFGTVSRHNPVYYLDDNACAQKYGRVWGMYEFKRPILAVADPDLLKTILVKECFTYFTNRRNLRLNGDLHDTVSLAQDDQWRRIRNILSPLFTSGRIKEVFGMMKYHSRKLTASLQSKAQNDEVINVKDHLGGYSTDVMASWAFSVDVDSINNPTSPLITHASQLIRVSIPIFLFQACFPFFLPLLELLGVSLFPKASTAFFKTLLEKIKAERKGRSHQNSGDLLDYLIDSQITSGSKKDKNKGLTDREIIAQVTIFMAGGYETSANTLTFLAYNLARHPEVMKRLQEEIDATFPNKGPVQYEALMQMEYLDSVVQESLRLYPPLPRVDRIAKESVTINGITIPKDMMVMIPVYALHHNPEIWPNPEEFRPDRFSKQNKQSINPYTYLPFGAGPRNCMGMRFALVMIKLALVEVLQHYSFSVCKETEIPLRMDPVALVGPLQPIKLKVVPRSIECN